MGLLAQGRLQQQQQGSHAIDSHRGDDVSSRGRQPASGGIQVVLHNALIAGALEGRQM